MTDLELYALATRAVVGPTQGEVVARVFDALDLTKRHTHAEAYDMAKSDNWDNGYQVGLNDAAIEAYNQGYAAARATFAGDEQPDEVYNWWDIQNPAGC